MRYIPDRNDIVWLDFDPPRGKEVGKYRPALVLLSKAYNQLTGLLICCPISTSIRGGPTEVVISNLNRPSVVAASLIQTLDWRNRDVKWETKGEPGLFEEVLLRLLPLIGVDRVIGRLIDE